MKLIETARVGLRAWRQLGGINRFPATYAHLSYENPGVMINDRRFRDGGHICASCEATQLYEGRIPLYPLIKTDRHYGIFNLGLQGNTVQLCYRGFDSKEEASEFSPEASGSANLFAGIGLHPQANFLIDNILLKTPVLTSVREWADRTELIYWLAQYFGIRPMGAVFTDVSTAFLWRESANYLQESLKRIAVNPEAIHRQDIVGFLYDCLRGETIIGYQPLEYDLEEGLRRM